MKPLDALLNEAARDGMEQVLLYRTASGAWDCTARAHGKARTVIGHAVLRTPEAALGAALTEFTTRAPAAEGSVFD
jgi:hypothetical protein